MVFNATFNNIAVILWQSVLLMVEKVPRENQRPVVSHWQTLSYNVVSSSEYTSPWMGFELTSLVVIGTDCTGSCKFNYYEISTLMAPEGIVYVVMYVIMNN